jgi:hypothetical protein
VLPIRALAAVVPAVTAAVVGALGLAGCSGDEERSEIPEPTPRATVSRVLLTDPDGERYIDRHPNGATLQVMAIEIRPNSIALEINLVNGHSAPVSLTRDPAFRDPYWVYLIDDFDNVYSYDGKAPLGVGPGEQLLGTLVFPGVPPAAAQSLVLKTNLQDPSEAPDLRERDRDDDHPVFYIEGIPLR